MDPALARVIDTLPDGVMLLDHDFRITYANQTARQISRVTPADFNNKTHWELYPETIGTTVEETYRRVMADRTEGRLETVYYEPFDVWLKVHVLPIAGGIALYYRDVTATQTAQAAAQSAAAQLEQVLAATTDGVVALDRDYTITYVNPRAREIVAASGEILHTNLWTTFPHANFPGSPFVEHYARAMNDRVPSGFVAFYPEPLNAWLDVDARPSPNGIIVFFRDVTRQKANQDELSRSEERYRVLTELSPTSQWMANAQGLVLYANQRFLDYIGHDFVPTTGEEYIECFDPEDRARVIEVWTHSILTGEDYAIDARLLRAADGASRWWQLRALPVRDEAGVIQQWLGTAVDIHETRLAADRLTAQYAEIEAQSREMESIYAGSPIGMALYDAKDLRLLRINDRQAEIFRRPAG